MRFSRSDGTVGFVRHAIDNNGVSSPMVVPGMLLVGPRISKRGTTITTGGTSAYTTLPNNSDGASPAQIMVSSTAAAYVRLGDPSEASAVVSAAGTGYNVGDTITLTGGTGTAATLTVATSKLVSAAINAAGTGYAPSDTITLGGGTAATKAIVTVTHTKVVSATIDVAGTGGTPGAATVTGTTGTGTPFQATVTISAGGIITSVNSISVAGDYTVNPTDVAHEPVTGGSLVGAQLAVGMGVKTFTVSTPGSYTVQPTTFTQFATTGTGTGATFQTALFGVLTATVTDPGDYSVDPTNPVAQGSTSGAGTGATFNMTFVSAAAAGDILVTPGFPLILDATGFDHIAAIQVSGAGVVQISPIDG